jgi:hypothetical protein
MVFPAMNSALDMWTLLVTYVFGSFWLAVVGIALLMFLIMGWLGKISIYSCTWYIIMFLLAMCLGYGYAFLNVVVTFAVLVAFYFSLRNYIG